MSSAATMRRAQRQHEIERNFVRHPVALPAPRHNRSSIVLPHFAGISFRIIGKHRSAVYHQIDGSVELAAACTCIVHFSGGGLPPALRVERVSDCPIDEHRISYQRELMVDDDGEEGAL
jgi:hypothetical protein